MNPETGHPNGSAFPASTAGSMSPPASATAQKRRGSDHDDAARPGRQPRAKRKKYVGNACTNCHRRHIRCNGQQPCERCSKMKLDCEYAATGTDFRETEEYQQMQSTMQTMQTLMSNMQAQLAGLQQSQSPAGSSILPHIDTGHGRSSSYPNTATSPFAAPMSHASSNTMSSFQHPQSHTSQPRHSQFQGPTSFQFNFNRAKNTLETMGIHLPKASQDDETGTQTGQATPEVSDPSFANSAEPEGSLTTTPRRQDSSSGAKQIAQAIQMHPDKDALWYLSKSEAIRLVNVWQDEMGEMYPIADFEDLLRYTGNLYTFIESAARSGLMQAMRPGKDAILDDEAMILKAVLAISLTLEGGGRSELGCRMFEDVKKIRHATIELPAEPYRISMVALAAMYHFHRDNEGLAWRVLGLAARMTMELGLHQASTYAAYTDEKERHSAIRLFWSIYVLDRRWSFGTGRSFALQDADIDPAVPKPGSDTYYLAAMVDYAQLSSKVWRNVANLDTSRNQINEEDMRYYEQQVLQWHHNLPSALKYDPENPDNVSSPGSSHGSTTHSLSRHRRRVVQYLRRNQMRILIYRPILHTATSISEHRALADRVVDIARDSIRTITTTDRTTEVYKTQPVMFNYFLVSALAVLFLAVSHAPANFSETCRDEFFQAVEMIRGLSADSLINKRLWKSVRELKDLGARLGLHSRTASGNGPDQPPPSDGPPPHLRPHAQASAGAGPGPGRFARQDAALAIAELASGQRGEQQPPPPPPPPGQALQQTPTPGATGPWSAVPGTMDMDSGGGGPAGTTLNESPNGVANDLTSLFEAAGGSYALGGMLTIGPGGGAPVYQGGTALEMEQDELSKILGDLF